MNDNAITKKELIQTLGEFTEETLLPAVSSMMDDKLDRFEDKMDDKFANLTKPEVCFGAGRGTSAEVFDSLSSIQNIFELMKENQTD